MMLVLGYCAGLRILDLALRALARVLEIGRGAQAIVLTNQNGAILELSGRQVGLMANADLSGLAITIN